jgi:GT2 family glycosyltransferase
MHNIQIKSEAEQQDFFDRSYACYKAASVAVGVERHFFDIAGTIVCMSFAGNRLVPVIVRALEHLRVDEVAKPDFNICLWDGDSTGVDMIEPPCDWNSFTNRGDIWGFNSHRIRTAFHWVENSVNLMNMDTNTAIWWVQKTETLPFWVYASPLRTLLHWWMEKNGKQLIHAAAVGTDDGALLITGASGVGKSTTALSCLRRGFYYLADDYLVVGLDPEPQVYTLYSTAKLNAGQVANLPEFDTLITNRDNLYKDKAVMFLYPHFAEQIQKSMSLKAILIPSIRDRAETGFSLTDDLSAQRAAAFTTLSQLPYAGRQTHDFLDRLAAALPKFNLELGRDLEAIPGALSRFLHIGPQNVAATLPRPVAREEKSPVISVIIPTYNAAKFIRDAIQCVLDQDYPSVEIIVIDDGSTDNTGEIIQSIDADIRYYKQDNNGAASARNRGIKDASSHLIAFLDVDDLWPENNLRVLVDELMDDPELQVVHGHAQLMMMDDETGKFEYVGNPEESFPYYIGAGLYRRSVFQDVGLFDEELAFAEDTDWFERAKHLGIPVKRIDQVTLFVRRHGNNMTSGKADHELHPLRMVKKTLDRLRKEKPDEAIHLPPRGRMIPDNQSHDG